MIVDSTAYYYLIRGHSLKNNKGTFRNLALQSNYQQGNLKACLLIKSGYYIVPNPSTTLPVIFYNCSSLFDWNKGMSCFIYHTWVTISKTTSLWNVNHFIIKIDRNFFFFEDIEFWPKRWLSPRKFFTSQFEPNH